MQTYNNDRLLVESKTPANESDCEPQDLDLVMCIETYNICSQYIMDSKDAKEAGLRALSIMGTLSEDPSQASEVFSHLETAKARRLAGIALREIFTIIMEGNNIESSGRKAIAFFSRIRPDHTTAVSLEDIGLKKGKCTKQNLSKHGKRVHSKLARKLQAV